MLSKTRTEQIASKPTWAGRHKTAARLALTLALALGGLPAWGIDDRGSDWLRDEVSFGFGKLRVGDFDIRSRFGGMMIYDDNVNIHSGTGTADLIWVLSPGLSVGTGSYLVRGNNYLKLDFTPRILLFQNESQHNAIDHDTSLSGQWQIAKLTVGLQQTVNFSSGGVLEFGNRLDRVLVNLVGYQFVIPGSPRAPALSLLFHSGHIGFAGGLLGPTITPEYDAPALP